MTTVLTRIEAGSNAWSSSSKREISCKLLVFARTGPFEAGTTSALTSEICFISRKSFCLSSIPKPIRIFFLIHIGGVLDIHSTQVCPQYSPVQSTNSKVMFTSHQKKRQNQNNLSWETFQCSHTPTYYSKLSIVLHQQAPKSCFSYARKRTDEVLQPCFS